VRCVCVSVLSGSAVCLCSSVRYFLRFFFCRLRRPPWSTLFPYTTLFRSESSSRRSSAVTHANVCPDRHICCRTRTRNCDRRQPAMADSLCRDHVCDRFTAKERDHDTEPPHHPDAPPADSGRRNGPGAVTDRLRTARRR